jgi:hypothetical protein
MGPPDRRGSGDDPVDGPMVTDQPITATDAVGAAETIPQTVGTPMCPSAQLGIDGIREG